LPSGELPLDSDFVPIGAAIPSFGLAVQFGNVANPAPP
jgi:hypothetical protein